MNKTNIVTNVFISVLVVVAALSMWGGKTTVVNQPLGASGTGQETSSRQFFLGGLTEGGIAATSSTASTYTTVGRDFANTPTVINWTPNVNTTISLSGTSTNAYVPKVGDVAQIYFRNASTTAASSITFAAADANADLQFSEATGGDLVLNGLDWMKVTVIHTSQFLYTFILDEMTEAD